MKLRLIILAIFCGVIFAVPAARVSAQFFDISSGGSPTITGAVGGSVTGSSSVMSNLVVTVNFGEISPANPNALIKVVVPIAIRSTAPYRVTVTISGTANANPQAVQASDVGFGANNLRPFGSQASNCTNSSHDFYSPFNNDPALTKFIAANGRVAYQSTLANLTISGVILSGPRLTRNNNGVRNPNDGHIFDAIFAITPQFFAPVGTSSATLTFNISSGPNAPC